MQLARLQTLVSLVSEKVVHRASVVAWQVHRIVWGRWQDGGIVLADGSELDIVLMQEMRIFNETEELHLHKRGDGFAWRYIDDESGESSEFIDSASRLWGKKTSEAVDGFVRLADRARKISMVVPTEANGEFYELMTRNYIAYDAMTGQAGYGDYRFLRIVAAGRD